MRTLDLRHDLVRRLMRDPEGPGRALTLCHQEPDSGRLLLGYDPHRASARTLERALALRIGADAFQLRPLRAFRHAKKQELNRPLVGGLLIKAPSVEGQGSAGVLVVLDEMLGVITAGHVVESLDTLVYQPRYSDSHDWKIGKVVRISDYANRARSDSAFIQLDGGVEGTTWRVWKSSNSLYTVTDTVEPALGAAVSMQGASTQQTERSGVVCSLDATVRFADGGVLEKQYLANYLSQVGDSGAPVYIKQADPSVELIGINVGGTEPGDIQSGAPNPDTYPTNGAGEYAIISPWESVLQDLFDGD